MQMQAEIYRKRQQVGGSIAYDVLLSDYRTSLEQQIAAIGRVMGICAAAASDPAILAFLAAMMRYLHDKPDKDMGITRMHDTHSQKQRDGKCSEIMRHMRTDSTFASWQDANA